MRVFGIFLGPRYSDRKRIEFLKVEITAKTVSNMFFIIFLQVYFVTSRYVLLKLLIISINYPPSKDHPINGGPLFHHAVQIRIYKPCQKSKKVNFSE